MPENQRFEPAELLGPADEAADRRRQIGRRRGILVEGGILEEDPLLQLGNRRRRVDPEFLGEGAAETGQRPQGVGLTARPIQDARQQLPETFPIRMFGGQGLHGARFRDSAGAQLGFDPVLLGS